MERVEIDASGGRGLSRASVPTWAAPMSIFAQSLHKRSVPDRPDPSNNSHHDTVTHII